LCQLNGQIAALANDRTESAWRGESLQNLLAPLPCIGSACGTGDLWTGEQQRHNSQQQTDSKMKLRDSGHKSIPYSSNGLPGMFLNAHDDTNYFFRRPASGLLSGRACPVVQY
jgi:hypothetical protein